MTLAECSILTRYLQILRFRDTLVCTQCAHEYRGFVLQAPTQQKEDGHDG